MNKENRVKNGISSLLKRFDGKVKDIALLAVLGLVIIAMAWVVFHTEDGENAIPTYATETETKVLRMLQELLLVQVQLQLFLLLLVRLLL